MARTVGTPFTTDRPSRTSGAAQRNRRTLGERSSDGAGALRAACEEQGVRCDEAPVVMSGHVELGRLLLEQAISRTLHRYGRVTG